MRGGGGAGSCTVGLCYRLDKMLDVGRRCIWWGGGDRTSGGTAAEQCALAAERGAMFADGGDVRIHGKVRRGRCWHTGEGEGGGEAIREGGRGKAWSGVQSEASGGTRRWLPSGRLRERVNQRRRRNDAASGWRGWNKRNGTDVVHAGRRGSKSGDGGRAVQCRAVLYSTVGLGVVRGRGACAYVCVCGLRSSV